MFFDNYVSLCKSRGLPPSTLAVILGFSKGTYGQWKNGSIPNNQSLKTIADYFGISVDELSGDIKKPDANNGIKLSDTEKSLLCMLRELPPDKREIVEQLAESLYNTK